jgi:predicted RNase H-like HicB family nuclease
MKLAAKISKLPSGDYQAWCPALPGCRVVGQSPEDVSAKIERDVKGYLASLDVALPAEVRGHLEFTSVPSAA